MSVNRIRDVYWIVSCSLCSPEISTLEPVESLLSSVVLVVHIHLPSACRVVSLQCIPHHLIVTGHCHSRVIILWAVVPISIKPGVINKEGRFWYNIGRWYICLGFGNQLALSGHQRGVLNPETFESNLFEQIKVPFGVGTVVDSYCVTGT